MNTPQKITLARAISALPYAEKTLYNGHSLGRYPWLSRSSPWGARTRELWVDVPALLDWAAVRGVSLNLMQLGGGKK